MLVTDLTLPGVVRIDIQPIEDSRGFFARFFCRDEFARFGIDATVSQCNNTLTRVRGSIRGFHYQRPPKAEHKIIRCVSGAIFDVAVDLRAGSPTFGKHCSCELTCENRAMMAIPPGFAHGFQALTEDVELIYFHSQPYSRELEGGVNPLDESLGVKWPLPASQMSERDLGLSGLSEVEPIVL